MGSRARWDRWDPEALRPSASGAENPIAEVVTPIAEVITPRSVLALQHTAGNQAVARLLAPASRPRPGGARGMLQRVLEDYPGPEVGGKWNGSMGVKELLKETDDGKLYFKSGRSTKTDWVLIEVRISEDGKKYEKTGAEKTVKAPKKVPRTVADWRAVAYVSGDTMLYPAQRYPHVTIDLTRPVRDDTDIVVFETMHYSRSYDDPYRSGYRLTGAGWQPVKPNDKKDKQKECDDAVDSFLEQVGLSQRVIRA